MGFQPMPKSCRTITAVKGSRAIGWSQIARQARLRRVGSALQSPHPFYGCFSIAFFTPAAVVLTGAPLDIAPLSRPAKE